MCARVGAGGASRGPSTQCNSMKWPGISQLRCPVSPLEAGIQVSFLTESLQWAEWVTADEQKAASFTSTQGNMRLKETACRMRLSCGIWRRNKNVLSGWNSSVYRVGRFFTARERSVTETSNTSCRSLQSLLLTNSFMINDEETEKPSEDLNIFALLSCLPLLKTRPPSPGAGDSFILLLFFFLSVIYSLHASFVHIFHSFFSPSFLPSFFCHFLLP